MFVPRASTIALGHIHADATAVDMAPATESRMLNTEINPHFADPNPCFLCSDLNTDVENAKYRVPLCYRNLGTEAGLDSQDLAIIEALPDIEGVRQLRMLVEDSCGIGIWVPLLAYDLERKTGAQLSQETMGAITVFPPCDWQALKSELTDWCFEGVEQEFENLPYSFEDVLPFARINYSPDLWFLILKGEMAGKVCFWGHEGDCVMEEPWADDIRAWSERIFTTGPEVLGGMAQYSARDSIDLTPDNAVLCPRKYVADYKAV